MKFSLAKGPFVRSKKSTTSIMLELLITLVVVWLGAIISYSIRYNFSVGLRVFLVVFTSLLTTTILDVIMALVKGKRTFKEIVHFVVTNYSYITAIIFALCLPAGVNLYAVVIGALVATFIGKYVFGGFGYNVFNPAIIGRIVVGIAFGSSLNYGIQASGSSYDFVTGATVTGSIDWSNGLIPEGFTFKDLLLGNYNGAIGETCTVLLLICAIYLIVRGIIDYRLFASYIITVTCCAFFVGLFYNPNEVFSYTLLHLVTGGIMFGAVFMITDPVTGPKAMNAKVIYGVVAGALTMFIRVNSDYPEGVMYSIALANMVTPLMDNCIKGNTFDHNLKRWGIIALCFVLGVGINVGYEALYPINASEEEQTPQVDPNAWMKSYTVTKIDDTTYTVKSEAYDGPLELKVYLDLTNEKITKVEILDVNSQEYYHAGIDMFPNYDTFVGDSLDLKFADIESFTCKDLVCRTTSSVDFDTTTDATYTYSAFVGNLKAVIVTAKGGNN